MAKNQRNPSTASPQATALKQPAESQSNVAVLDGGVKEGISDTPASHEDKTVDVSCSVMIEVPVGHPDDRKGYAPKQLRELSFRKAAILQDIYSGLAREGALLRDKRAVDTPDRALEWLLEQIDGARAVK